MFKVLKIGVSKIDPTIKKTSALLRTVKTSFSAPLQCKYRKIKK